MNLDIQVKQNALAIQQLLDQAKNLKELPLYDNTLSNDDLILFYLDSIDQTVALTFGHFIGLLNNEYDFGFVLQEGNTTDTGQSLRDAIDANETEITAQDIRIGEVEGLGLFANQAAQEIYIKNASGTILSTLSVAFLNNEGTVFSYNDVTKKLELKNDQGVLLAEVPVSAFVGNLAANLSLNSNKLSLKDSENNEISFVEFQISNISGLQDALDAKETPAGAQIKANTAEQNAKDYADTLDNNRTVVKKSNIATYPSVVDDFSKNLLEFTANSGEIIEVIVDKDLVTSGGLQAISTGNNQLKPVGGTDVTLIFPDGASDKTIPKGMLSVLATGTPNVYKIDGSLESLSNEPQIAAQKPIKVVPNTSQYTFEVEDRNFFLVFSEALSNVYIPGQTFSPSDELQGTFRVSDVTISSAVNSATDSSFYSLEYPVYVTNNFIKKGTFGLKFISETEVTFAGHQKPV